MQQLVFEIQPPSSLTPIFPSQSLNPEQCHLLNTPGAILLARVLRGRRIWDCSSQHLAPAGSQLSLQPTACTDQLATSVVGTAWLEGTCRWLRASSSSNWLSSQSNLGQRGHESHAPSKLDQTYGFPANCWKSPGFFSLFRAECTRVKVIHVFSCNTNHSAFPMFYLVTITSCASTYQKDLLQHPPTWG